MSFETWDKDLNLRCHYFYFHLFAGKFDNVVTEKIL